MFVTKKQEWEEIKGGEYKALLIRGDAPLEIEEQKASIMAVHAIALVRAKNVKFFALDGNIWATDSTVIALGGEIECFGDSTVYVLSPKVKVTLYDKSTVHVVDFSTEVVDFPTEEGKIAIGNSKLAKISSGTNPVIKVITSQKEWDNIKTGEYEVVVIRRKKVDESEKINVDSQKAPYIVVLNDGSVIVHKDVTVFGEEGLIECRGGIVAAWEKGFRVFTKLIDGEVYQYLGNLDVYGGKFFAPKLWKLTLFTSQYKGEVGEVKEVEDLTQKGVIIK